MLNVFFPTSPTQGVAPTPAASAAHGDAASGFGLLVQNAAASGKTGRAEAASPAQHGQTDVEDASPAGMPLSAQNDETAEPAQMTPAQYSGAQAAVEVSSGEIRSALLAAPNAQQLGNPTPEAQTLGQTEPDVVAGVPVMEGGAIAVTLPVVPPGDADATVAQLGKGTPADVLPAIAAGTAPAAISVQPLQAVTATGVGTSLATGPAPAVPAATTRVSALAPAAPVSVSGQLSVTPANVNQPVSGTAAIASGTGATPPVTPAPASASVAQGETGIVPAAKGAMQATPLPAQGSAGNSTPQPVGQSITATPGQSAASVNVVPVAATGAAEPNLVITPTRAGQASEMPQAPAPNPELGPQVSRLPQTAAAVTVPAVEPAIGKRPMATVSPGVALRGGLQPVQPSVSANNAPAAIRQVTPIQPATGQMPAVTAAATATARDMPDVVAPPMPVQMAETAAKPAVISTQISAFQAVAAQHALNKPNVSTTTAQTSTEAAEGQTPLGAQRGTALADASTKPAFLGAAETGTPAAFTPIAELNGNLETLPAQRSDAAPLQALDMTATAKATAPQEATAPKAPPKPFAEALISQVKSVEVAEGRTTVNLHPRGLGAIEVEIVTDKDAATKVVLRIENPAVLQSLRAERDLLAQAIGVSDSSQFEFHEHQAGDQSGGQSGQQQSAPELGAASSTIGGPSQHKDVVGNGQLDILT
jgi:hypothetical protein